MVQQIDSSVLNWLGKPPHVTGYVVADKRAYGVHGVRVHSWHRTQETAMRELNRLHRQGDSTQAVYQLAERGSSFRDAERPVQQHTRDFVDSLHRAQRAGERCARTGTGCQRAKRELRRASAELDEMLWHHKL